MKPANTLAIAKAINKAAVEAAREHIVPGIYQIDQTVRIVGTITVAQDGEKAPTASIPLKDVLALFISRAGITRAASITLLSRCVTDALANGNRKGGVSESISNLADIDDVFTNAMEDMLSRLPKIPFKGAVRADLTVEEH